MVLAPDGSRFAEAAAVTEASLGRFCETRVAVASVTTPSHGRERREIAEQVVQRVVEHMKGEGIAAEGVVRNGYPSEVIASLARVLLGSTSGRILNDIPCAVLVVKPG